MTREPHDSLVKVFLPAWLSGAVGVATPGRAIASETREGDVTFVPGADPAPDRLAALGLLGQIARMPRLFEAYWKPVTPVQVEESVAKLLELRRAARAGQAPQAVAAPELCLTTPTLSEGLRRRLQLRRRAGDLPGVERLPAVTPGVIIVVHRLPAVPETLWFRLLGSGRVQREALAEVGALASTHPFREGTMAAISRYRRQLAARRRPMSQRTRQFVENSDRLLEAWKEEFRQEGRAEGRQEGRAEGRQEGQARGKAEAVIAVLEARGLAVTAAARRRVLACADPDTLDGWLRRAVSVPSTRALFSTTPAAD
jgi:hypothetical protein